MGSACCESAFRASCRAPCPSRPFIVRVLIPCYTESLDIVRKTVLAAANATLPEKSRRTVYLLDDGKDTAKAAWVAEQVQLQWMYDFLAAGCQTILMHVIGCRTGADIVYISGRVRQKGETNGKACNLNNTLAQLYPPGTEVDESEVCCISCLMPSIHCLHLCTNLRYIRQSLESIHCRVVVVFDADMVCYPDFFVKILAELYDPQVAIVLTPQKFWNYDINCDIFNHSNLIYWQVSLPGLDGWDNVSCTGTNFVVRAKAAQEVCRCTCCIGGEIILLLPGLKSCSVCTSNVLPILLFSLHSWKHAGQMVPHLHARRRHGPGARDPEGRLEGGIRAGSLPHLPPYIMLH